MYSLPLMLLGSFLAFVAGGLFAVALAQVVVPRVSPAPPLPAPPCTSPTTPPLMEIRLRINVSNLDKCDLYEVQSLSLNGRRVLTSWLSWKAGAISRTSGALETSDITLLKLIRSSFEGKLYLDQHRAFFSGDSTRDVVNACISELLSALLNSAEAAQKPPPNKSPRE